MNGQLAFNSKVLSSDQIQAVQASTHKAVIVQSAFPHLNGDVVDRSRGVLLIVFELYNLFAMR